jgi:hypothetical protein
MGFGVGWLDVPSRGEGDGMVNPMRAVAEALANLAEKAHQWADGTDDWALHQLAGVDIVGIDFSTSIQQIARHVIGGWDRYRAQMNVLRPDHGVWAFTVNSLPTPLTRRPVSPALLPPFCEGQFRWRGDGPGLVDYGSAFYDYYMVALEQAQYLARSNEAGSAPLAVTISLLCDCSPNGGIYRASDVRPLLEQARARGVRFRLVGLALRKHRAVIQHFQESLGLTCAEVEVALYDDVIPDGRTIASSFDSLSHF